MLVAMQSVRRAVIDVGTNSVKLLVADVCGNHVTPVHEESKQTRLGKGFYETHRLQPEPVARTAEAVWEFAETARERGIRAIIAGAGGAAHLPGMIAAKTIVPVFGVPVPSKYLRGEDSLLSIVQMPKGIPVATFAIGEAGAANAALAAIAMLATTDEALAAQLLAFREKQTQVARDMVLPV